MTKPKKRIILLVIILAVLSPVLYVVFGWLTLFVGLWVFTPNPPQPQKTYGEFPFTLTYTVNGETHTVEDVYVCKYDGVGADEGHGKYRTWSGYIKGSGETDVLIAEDADRKVYCFVGDAEFYMNDERYPEKRPLTPRLYDVEKNVDAEGLSPEEIAKVYDIEIVSWNFSEPIENSFG